MTIAYVWIGNPANAADAPLSNCYGASCGSVSYGYYISKYEVTNAQYAEFLNAKAASDPLSLYHMNMSSLGITQNGVSGSYSYSVPEEFTAKPVRLVSFFDALRFANWLNNGQGSADTETGAYTLLGGTATPSNWTTVTRNAGATVFLPSENEWYKAAYYSPGGYFDYPAGNDDPTDCAAPTATANSANCDLEFGAATDVGDYTGSASPYGTYDQGGNVWEWNEQIVGSARGLRGGSWASDALGPAALSPAYGNPGFGDDYLGFRVASRLPQGTSVPTVGDWGMIALTLLGLTLGTVAIGRRRRFLASAPAGPVAAAEWQPPLFVRDVFIRTLAATLGLLGAGSLGVFWVYGEIVTRDAVGSLLCALILAYLVHLWVVYARGSSS